MANIFKKTLGGLKFSYYIRNLFFAIVFGGFMMWAHFVNFNEGSYPFLGYLLICIILYPYSKFVYDEIVGFIMGDNVFMINIIFAFIIKSFVILTCLLFAPIVAPVGFIYLYFYHTKHKTFES